jgi:peptidyl-prolyl cis-trans isomerase D
MSPKTNEKKKLNPRVQAVKVKKKNKLLLISFIVTGAIIVGLIGFGILRATVLKNFIPVAEVNGQKIDNEYFKARVRWERYYSIEQYEMLAGDPELVELYAAQLQQIESLLDSPSIFGEYVLNAITEDEILSQKGKEMGVEVTELEIDDFIKEFFNYHPDGAPTPEPIATAYPTPTYSMTQEAILARPATPTSIATEELEVEEEISATNTPEITPQPTTTTSEPVENVAPTATPFTESMFKEVVSDYLGDLQENNISEEYIRKIFYHYLMNQKVTEAVFASVPREKEHLWARHILVETEEEAINVLTRLVSEDWVDVTYDVSIDNSNKHNGGDLHWFPRGQMVTAFEDVVFDLEIGEVAGPVETSFGWHIIQLLNRADLPLSNELYANEQNVFYQEWLTEINTVAEIEINDIWKDVVPTDPNIE